jgi:hypothetical protein
VKNWAIVPFIGCLENTKNTVRDLLEQTVQVNVLLVDNGSTLEEWNDIRKWATIYLPYAMDDNEFCGVFPWRHNPPLPSLAATWNTALDFVWASGGQHAMVCNNDIRLRPWTYDRLLYAQGETGALFVSAVNHPEGYEKNTGVDYDDINLLHRGGPDFSCYLLTKEGHEKYRFDESYIPAYCEDLDMHRRYMLGGDGSRIFSVAIPYLHVDNGSGTLKSFSPERREQFDIAVANGSRKYYEAKWGGGVNAEKFIWPFGVVAPVVHCENHCVTTPELQAHGCRGGRTD